MSDATSPTDVINLLIADHRAVEEAFGEFEGMSSDAADRGPLAEHIVTELVRHSVAEEQHLYPAVREVLPDGDRLADHHLQEHAEAEQVMKQLESSEPGSKEFDDAAVKLMTSIRHHVEDEESDLFPKLRGVCSVSMLEDLGAQVERAKELAPTRPHPSAPDKPPMNKILAPGAALVDRARDAFTGRQH